MFKEPPPHSSGSATLEFCVKYVELIEVSPVVVNVEENALQRAAALDAIDNGLRTRALDGGDVDHLLATAWFISGWYEHLLCWQPNRAARPLKGRRQRANTGARKVSVGAWT